MSKLHEYLEAAKTIKNVHPFVRCKEDKSYDEGSIVYYEGRKRKVKSDEGDKFILSGVKGYVWKTDCEEDYEK